MGFMQNSEKDLENKDKNSMSEDEKGADSRIYEVGYLLLPTLPEENIGKECGNLKEQIGSFNGEVISDGIPKMIPLVYSMEKVTANVRSKFNSAYFGWIKFAMDPEKVLELKKNLSQNPQLIRFLIFKTVKESTVAIKRFARDITYHRPTVSKKRDQTAVPINKEEIDKEIEAMVAQ